MTGIATLVIFLLGFACGVGALYMLMVVARGDDEADEVRDFQRIQDRGR